MNKNGIFTSRDDTDYSASTQKRLSSDKILLLVLAGIAAFCDLVTFIVGLVAGYGAGQIVATVFMLIADGLFIAGICFTNFRFKYSLAVWIGYVVASFILSIIMLASCSGGSGVYNMTTAATALVILSHLMLWVVIGVCALADNLFPRKSYVKIVLCVVTGVAVLFTFAYSVFVADKGYYGQNEDNNIRAVSYAEDDELDGYKAASVVEGRGHKIVIPSTFNGKKVVSVSADILCDGSIDDIVIEGGEVLEIRDFTDNTQISASLRIGVSKEVVDEYRNKYIGDATQSALTLVNSFYPADLADDETYITFAYGWAESNQVKNNLLPTWIGKKGEIFDLEEYAEQNGITYIVNGDIASDEDLHWSMLNNNGYVFKDVTCGSAAVDGASIDDDVYRASVNFDKIYKIRILDDNDALYEPDDSFKTVTLDDTVYDYRYVAQSRADVLLGELSREGFSLSWKYIYNNAVYYVGSKGFSQTLADGKVSYEDGAVNIIPEWRLNAPVIESVTTDKAGNSFVYGDDMTLSVKADAPVAGYNLAYAWTGVGGESIGSGDDITLSCVNPDDAGRYTVTVTASSPLTSLTSQAVSYADVSVAKKVLRFTWTFPQNAVYDGTARQAVCEIVQSDVIDGDVLDVSTDAQAVISAGSYTSKVLSLSGDNARYYALDSSAQYSYSVAKRPLTLVWEEKGYTYDGSYQYPRVISASNAVSGEENGLIAGLSYSGYGKNAGEYTVKVALSSSDYTIEQGATNTYSIDKKQVTLVWQSESSYVYNGNSQYPKVTDVTGTLESEKTMIFANLVYSGYGYEAGSHTVSVKLGAGSSNYLLTGTAEKSYEIDRKPLTVYAEAKDKTYDGKAGGEFSVTVSGLVAKDTIDSLGTPVYSGDAVDAVDAGSYTLYVSYAQNSVNKNYSITYVEDTFVISPKPAIAVWSDVREFVFDGEAHAPYIVTDGKEYDGQVQITYKYFTADGEEIDKPTQAGEYYVQAQLSSENYSFSPMSIDFSIRIQEDTQQ